MFGVGWLLKGLGGVGGCMLYEGWFEVEVVDVVVRLGRGSGSLDGSTERADLCASILYVEHVKDPADR